MLFRSSFIGRTVDVVYDPADISELVIEYEGYSPWKSHELVIGNKVGKRPELPDHIAPQTAHSSRLLKAAKEKNEERHKRQIPAISYRRVCKGE